MGSKVAIVEFGRDVHESLDQALRLIGKIDDLNTSKRSVVVKVGVFDPNAENHTTVSVADAIVKSFNKAPRIFLAESDNYRGKSLERLQLWKELFSELVIPFSLSEDAEARKVKLGGEEMRLSHILFKPNVLVSTHVLRGYDRGSILKNLFGLVPDTKKVRFHKKLDVLLADIYEAIGGIDLAVLDGTYLYDGFGVEDRVLMNTLLVGRDAVAVETVGGLLAGLKPEKMPILHEFVKRGFGEGDLENIEIVGASLENTKEKIESAAKTHTKMHPKRGPAQTWGGRTHNVMKSLVQEGFFKLPNKRTREDVARALEARGLQTKGKENQIVAILTRRVKNGVLKATGESDGCVYWTE